VVQRFLIAEYDKLFDDDVVSTKANIQYELFLKLYPEAVIYSVWTKAAKYDIEGNQASSMYKFKDYVDEVKMYDSLEKVSYSNYEYNVPKTPKTLISNDVFGEGPYKKVFVKF
jgi:hypothetical protein